MTRWPSLHIPVVILAGLLAGLGVYYVLLWIGMATVFVPLAIALLLVWEVTRGVLQWSRRTFGDQKDQRGRAPAPPISGSRFKPRRDLTLLGIASLLGVGLGHLFWGPLTKPDLPYDIQTGQQAAPTAERIAQ
ncbi:hypothetical protein ERN12_11675 [Rhodobacteraceae bacterium]|nr:hypothetical protein ERN12_11675 [Paracoccaceae bacterium]